MKRAIAISTLLALLALAAIAQGTILQKDNIRVHFDANFSPRSLPRDHPAPVEIAIQGSIATTDGSHPPALQWLEIELNRNGQVFTEGLPVCSAPLLQSTSTDEALSRCGNAKVGTGSFDALVNLGGDVPASGKILAFNSRRSGKPALLLHFFASLPIRFTLVVPLVIERRAEGEFGTLLRTRVPKLGGGLGSITEIDLTLGRRYSVGGKRRSYLTAACRAPVGFDGGPFKFARARFRFESHAPLRPEPLLKTCKVR